MRWGGIFDLDGLRHNVDRLTNLSLAEGSLIAGLVPAPSRYTPRSRPDLAKQRQKFVLGEMLELGAHLRPETGVDGEDAGGEIAIPVEVVDRQMVEALRRVAVDLAPVREDRRPVIEYTAAANLRE